MRDVDSIISELEQQKSAIERAIGALREIAGVGAPSKLVSAAEPGTAVTKKRVLSPEGRRRIIEATKKRWAAKRAEDAKVVSDKAQPAAKRPTRKRSARKR